MEVQRTPKRFTQAKDIQKGTCIVRIFHPLGLVSAQVGQ